MHRPEHRFDAIAIPCSDELPLRLVVNTQRKLATQVLHKPRHTIALVDGDDEFRVGCRAEVVVRGELIAEAVEVVDLAIDDDVDVVVWRVQGLRSGGS